MQPSTQDLTHAADTFAARESARRPNGQFGTQTRPEPGLAGQVEPVARHLAASAMQEAEDCGLLDAHRVVDDDGRFHIDRLESLASENGWTRRDFGAGVDPLQAFRMAAAMREVYDSCAEPDAIWDALTDGEHEDLLLPVEGVRPPVTDDPYRDWAYAQSEQWEQERTFARMRVEARAPLSVPAS